MKLKIAILISLLNLSFALYSQTSETKNKFFPLKVGNYWVYSDSRNPLKNDTVKVTDTKIIGKDTAYFYNGSFWKINNDTLYQYQTQRNGHTFPTVQYFPFSNPTDFTIVIGGDALAERSVRKLKCPYIVNSKEYFNCYEYKEWFENGFLYTIISYGIGIIEVKAPTYNLSLIEYKIE